MTFSFLSAIIVTLYSSKTPCSIGENKPIYPKIFTGYVVLLYKKKSAAKDGGILLATSFDLTAR